MNDAAPVESIRKAYHPELVILVVEDQIIFSREIKHALAPHTAIVAPTLEDAKKCYDASSPDLTFLDLDLPDGNGLELIDYIRARDPQAYIVILTGSKLAQDITASRQKGVDGYIIKPFTRTRIDHAMESYLQAREKGIKSLIQQTQDHRLEALTKNHEA